MVSGVVSATEPPMIKLVTLYHYLISKLTSLVNMCFNIPVRVNIAGLVFFDASCFNLFETPLWKRRKPSIVHGFTLPSKGRQA